MNKWKKFLPTPQQLSQETLATLCGVILSAWIISKIPALQQMVRENNIGS